MKLLVLVLSLVGSALLGLPLMVFSVVATHPWLAVGMLTAPVTVRDDRAAPVVRGVPAAQWPLMVAAANGSTCGVSAEDLAAIARIDNTSVDALPAIAQTLCARGYGANRTGALNRYAGCNQPLCLGATDYATAVASLAATLRPVQGVVHVAEQWLGVPYVFGGCSRSGVDCSCLVQLVYRTLGISLPRVAADQWRAVQHIPRDDLQPGDLVFFRDTYMPGLSHVGIYVGHDDMINAPTEGQSVSVMHAFSGYWGAHYAGAGRVELTAP